MFAFLHSEEFILLNQHLINWFINYILLQVDNKLSSQQSLLQRSLFKQHSRLANWTFHQTGKIRDLFECQVLNCLTGDIKCQDNSTSKTFPILFLVANSKSFSLPIVCMSAIICDTIFNSFIYNFTGRYERYCIRLNINFENVMFLREFQNISIRNQRISHLVWQCPMSTALLYSVILSDEVLRDLYSRVINWLNRTTTHWTTTRPDWQAVKRQNPKSERRVKPFFMKNSQERRKFFNKLRKAKKVIWA